MAYNLHDLKVTGIELKEILGCVVEGRKGEHGSLVLQAYAEDEKEILYHTPSSQPLEVWLETEGEREILFAGIITNISLTVSGDIRVIRVEAKTGSWLLDLTERARSFQDTGMTYKQLTEQVLGIYEDSSLLYAAGEKETGRLIVQYGETDWAFLKRVLSGLGKTLTPEGRSRGIKLYAGIPELPEREPPFRITDMEKDMDRFYYLKANGRQVQAADFTRYEIVSEELMGIFEKVKLGGQALTIDSFRYVFDGQEMTGIYTLQKEQGLKEAETYPMNLIGVALKGKVLKVSGDRVQAALDIDRGYGTPALYWFVYSTMSASSNGTGWYCMPEEGDEIRIYFPSKDENEAIALSAVSSYEAPGNGQADRMADPDNRYLRTKAGQELTLAPGYLKLACGNGMSSVTVQNSGRVSVSAAQMVQVTAEKKISIHAEKKLTVRALENITLQSVSGGSVILDGADIRFQGTEVKFD